MSSVCFWLGVDNYVVTEGSCVRSCSNRMYEVKENGIQRCKDCDGPCPKGRERASERHLRINQIT